MAGLFRAGAARANYLALGRPDIAHVAKGLCRRMRAPRVVDLAAHTRVARYLRGPQLPRSTTAVGRRCWRSACLLTLIGRGARRPRGVRRAVVL